MDQKKKKTDVENIFYHTLSKGKRNNQLLNFKSSILTGQMKYIPHTIFFYRQSRGLWTDLNILKKLSLLLYSY